MDLLKRLRKVEPDGEGERTRWYRNPDGPEAADEIERLRELLKKDPNVYMITHEDGDHKRLSRALVKAHDEVERLREALKEAVYLLNPTEEDMEKKAGVYRVVTALQQKDSE